VENFVWSPEFSVGVGLLDEQHKRIISMINQLSSVKEVTTDSEMISDLITKMTQYSQKHLKYEEELLLQYRYPLFEEHKQDHRYYLKKIVAFTLAIPNGIPEVPQEVSAFLNQWWQNHILNEDMKYKPFLQQMF